MWFWRRRKEGELEEEVRSHLEMAAKERVARGDTTEQAEGAARREFGNVELVKEVTRDVWGWRWLEDLYEDARFGLRMLWKNPGFTAVAVLSLALGIGANSAIFSLVNAILLKPLPYAHSERLVMAWEKVRLPSYQNDRNDPAPGNFVDWQKQNTVFQDMAAIRYRSFNLTGEGEPVRVEGEGVSASVFPMLQVNAVLGRVFTPDEDRTGVWVVLMSHALWVSRFGARPEIVGKTILLDGESYEVIGILPEGFHFPDPDDQLWVPAAFTPSERVNHGSHYLRVVAELKPEINLPQARAQMDGIARHLTEQYPDTNTGVGVTLVPLSEQIVGNVRPALLTLMGAFGLTLLMVCANVGNLLLARGSVRRREMGIRVALGANRARILRQLLTESVLLALLGGAVGVVLAYWGVKSLAWVGPPDLLRINEIGVNGRVLLFTLGISVLAGIGFGIAPALEATRHDVEKSLKSGLRESPVGSRINLRNVLIVAEMAMGVVVLVGAGLLLRSFVRLAQAPLGFQTQNLQTFRVIPRGEKYSQPERRITFYKEAIEKIEALPGVKSASAVTFLPLTQVRGSKGFSIEGRAPFSPGQIPMADYDVVTPGYFQTMRIPLIEGRDFSWDDHSQTRRVIVINESMARTFWPHEDPLNKRIKEGQLDDPAPWLTVVGVAGDIRQFNVSTEPRPAMYFPVTQFKDARGVLRDWVVRSSGDSPALAAAVRSVIWSLDKDLPISRVRSMQQVRSTSVAPQAFNLLLLGLSGCLALILAAVGLYGVTSYAVAQRSREIGIRMALGAQPRDVRRHILKEGTRLAMTGLGVGAVAALALSRLIASLLYGITSTDPITFAAVAFVLTIVAVAACWIPARRATRVDPIEALRYE